ncbi:MAG TPA: serine hydrolase, partial [Polyangiaceae bacterium]
MNAPRTIRSETLDLLARERVTTAGVAPAAVLGACGRGEGDEWHLALGAAGVRSASRPTPIDLPTPFDLASLTKPVVAAAVARLVRDGTLDWGSR